MLELVDKTDLKSVVHLDVWVRVPFEALILTITIMVFTLFKSSSWSFEDKVEINSLDDLKDLQDKYHYKLIIDLNANVIEIYDDYRE